MLTYQYFCVCTIPNSKEKFLINYFQVGMDLKNVWEQASTQSLLSYQSHFSSHIIVLIMWFLIYCLCMYACFVFNTLFRQWAKYIACFCWFLLPPLKQGQLKAFSTPHIVLVLVNDWELADTGFHNPAINTYPTLWHTLILILTCLIMLLCMYSPPSMLHPWVIHMQWRSLLD